MSTPNTLSPELKAQIEKEAEEWRDVTGYEGHYQVSNLGRVRSVKKYVNGGKAGVNSKEGKILKSNKVAGYQRVTLSIDNKKQLKTIHRLVAIAFIPNPQNKPAVNHIDANRSNNILSNLEWCTTKENSHHSHHVLGYKMSNTTKNKIQRHAKIRALKDRKPIKCLQDGLLFSCAEEAGKHYGLSASRVAYIARSNGTSKSGKSFVFATTEYNYKQTKDGTANR